MELKINIMGIDYKLISDKNATKYLDEINSGGETDFAKRVIKIKEYQIGDEEANKRMFSTTLRHEIIHACLYECGLAFSSNGTNCWAVNEEMVDWFAIMWPRVNKSIHDTYVEIDTKYPNAFKVKHD